MYFHIGFKSNTVVRDPDIGQEINYPIPKKKDKSPEAVIPSWPRLSFKMSILTHLLIDWHQQPHDWHSERPGNPGTGSHLHRVEGGGWGGASTITSYGATTTDYDDKQWVSFLQLETCLTLIWNVIFLIVQRSSILLCASLASCGNILPHHSVDRCKKNVAKKNQKETEKKKQPRAAEAQFLRMLKQMLH